MITAFFDIASGTLDQQRRVGTYTVDGIPVDPPAGKVELEILPVPSAPAHNAERQRLVLSDAQRVGDTWTRVYSIIDLTADEIRARRVAQIEAEAERRVNGSAPLQRRLDRIERMLEVLITDRTSPLTTAGEAELDSLLDTYRNVIVAAREIEEAEKARIEGETDPDVILRPALWVQPLGASVPGFEPYAEGATVWHEGQGWESLIADNVSEPGVANWRALATGSNPPAWVQPTGAGDAYAIGDEVTHPRISDGRTVWVWSSNIAANTTEPGTDSTFDRWWEPVRAAD